MRIETLASGSTGNAYLVSDEKTTLLLECGIPYRQLQKRSGYRLHQIDACLITHEHGDHARAAKDLAALGIPIYCTQGTADAIGLRCLCIGEAAEPIGTFNAMALPVEHDAAQPVGWLLASRHSGEQMCFFTDTCKVDYVFQRPLDHIMIECNYLNEDALGDTNAFLAERVIHSHMSLSGCIDFLQRQDLSRCRDIRLLHLSGTHGDPQKMKQAVQAATGKRVMIAQYGSMR